MNMRRHFSKLPFFLLLSQVPALQAQQIPAAGITIRQAVESAKRNYPAIAVSQQQIDAAAAGIQLARTAYLPRVDSIVQANLATRNNVFGLLLPQSVIPSISGPVLGTNSLDSVWGSAIGVTVSWEPFDFGLRGANITAATAAKTRTEATLKRSQLDISVAAADAFLTLVAAQETVRAAQAGVDRAQSILQSVRTQSDAQLRPGADVSRSEAELAAARTQLIKAQQAQDVARALLSQFIGIPPEQITLSVARLLQIPPEQTISPLDIEQNPAFVEQNAIINQRKAELEALEKSYVPKFLMQSSAFARGTGALTNGTRLGGVNGLAPDTQNYAVGVSLTFPFFDRSSIHARESGQEATIRAETARSLQIATELTSRRNVANAALDGSRRIAANTPVAVAAAMTANQQANARYQAGLGTIVEVVDSQRLLTQAEIDDALARLSVWRALLSVAASSGDLEPFLVGTAP
jgi:outer membrane protein